MDPAQGGVLACYGLAALQFALESVDRHLEMCVGMPEHAQRLPDPDTDPQLFKQLASQADGCRFVDAALAPGKFP